MKWIKVGILYLKECMVTMLHALQMDIKLNCMIKRLKMKMVNNNLKRGKLQLLCTSFLVVIKIL